MNFDKVERSLKALDTKRNELDKLLRIENKTKEGSRYWVEIESLQLEFSKSEVTKILDEKKTSLENEIRTLAKELSEVE